MDIPATSDNIPGTLVLRDADGVVKSGNSGFIKEFNATASSSNRNVLVGRRTDAGGLFRITQQDGSGRLNITWNVEGDSVGSGTYASSASEPALRLLITTTGFLFYTAPANTAGNAITWTEVFRINLDGAVGISTATPTAKLHVSGNAIVAANTSTDALRITQEGSGNALVVEDSTNPDSTPFIVTADGNVGIGVGSSPTSKLHVGGVMTLGQFQGIQSVDRNSNTFISGGSSYDNGANIYLGGPDVAGGHLIISTGAGATNTERMRVDGSGNVGIGLTDPQNYGKLAVSGSLFLSGETSLYNPFGAVDAANRANTYIAFGLGGSGNDWAYLREIGTGNKLELALDLHDDGSDVNAGQAFSIRHLASSLTPDGGAQTLFKVNHDGNVGIGTAIPTAKLHVSGDAIISANTSTDALRITQEGSGNALVVEDSTNPDATPFVVTADGSVGIGTVPLPGVKLEVVGGIRSALLNIIDGAAATYRFLALNTNNVARWHVGTDNDAESGSNAGSNFFMHRWSDNGTFLERVLHISRSTGNIGINTSTPTERLDVNGTVKAAGFSADGIQIEGLSGRNYFRDSEAVGELRVGAAWGLPGIYAESGRCVVGGQAGVTIEPIGAGNVGIGTSTPNSKAMLDITSTTQGFLPPRMTTTQRDAITSPPAGLMVYNSTTNKLNFYNGTAWEAVTSA